jgi:hypothetical protein
MEVMNTPPSACLTLAPTASPSAPTASSAFPTQTSATKGRAAEDSINVEIEATKASGAANR